MKKRDRLTVSSLAALTGRELDDTLLTLWDAGIKEVNEPSDELIGTRLELAKRVMSLPTSKQLTSLSYWQRVLSLDEMQLRSLLNELGFPMSKNARKLPKGALRKLESKANKKTSIPIPMTVQPSAEASEPTPSAPVDALDWKTVGRVREIRLLSLEEVLKIHFTLVSDFADQEDPIDPPGPRNDDIIASAVFRQHTSIGKKLKYPSIEMSAAALIHSLVHDHPFHNGNKRTALVSTLVLLDENDLMLTCPEDELFKFVLQVAQHKIEDQNMGNLADREVLAIAEWFRERTRAVERGDRPLPFRRLRSILTAYGCSLEHSRSGSNMKITRTVQSKRLFSRTTTLTTNISHGGEGREVPCATINKIRADLHLDEENGVDSAAFYADFPFAVDDFIVKYRKTLNRLARL